MAGPEYTAALQVVKPMRCSFCFAWGARRRRFVLGLNSFGLHFETKVGDTVIWSDGRGEQKWWDVKRDKKKKKIVWKNMILRGPTNWLKKRKPEPMGAKTIYIERIYCFNRASFYKIMCKCFARNIILLCQNIHVTMNSFYKKLFFVNLVRLG